MFRAEIRKYQNSLFEKKNQYIWIGVFSLWSIETVQFYRNHCLFLISSLFSASWMLTPVTPVQRTRLGTTNVVEICWREKSVSSMFHLFWRKYDGFRFMVVMGLQADVFLFFCPNFMIRSEKEMQSYKLGHNRQKNKTYRFKGLSIKDKWHVHDHSRVFHVSRYRSKYSSFDNSYELLDKDLYRFFLVHYLETRVQLTTDHVLCLGTINTKQMVQQTRIWKPPHLNISFHYKRQFSRISREDRHRCAR